MKLRHLINLSVLCVMACSPPAQLNYQSSTQPNHPNAPEQTPIQIPTLTPGQRRYRGLMATANFDYSIGAIEKGNAAMNSIRNNGYVELQLYGGQAVSALQTKDYKVISYALNRLYENLPLPFSTIYTATQNGLIAETYDENDKFIGRSNLMTEKQIVDQLLILHQMFPSFSAQTEGISKTPRDDGPINMHCEQIMAGEISCIRH